MDREREERQVTESLPEPLTEQQQLSWFRWSVARFIAISRLPQVSAFIPAIGYALLWSDEFRRLLTSSGVLEDSFLPLRGRLQMLWWGAILMTIGWLIYLWKCPKEIRRNGAPDDYVMEQFQAPNGFRLSKARDVVAEQGKGYHPGDTKPLIIGGYSPKEVRLACHRYQSELKNAFEPNSAKDTEMIFNIQYHVIDHFQPWSCRVSLVTLTVGAVLFLLPSADVCLRVLRLLIF